MTTQENQEAFEAVAKQINLFSAGFYKAVIEDEESNLICSPVSISMVLAMAAFGAKGETEKQLCSALHLGADDEVTKAGYRHLIKSLNELQSVSVRLANKIYTMIGQDVEPLFLSITKDFFLSETQAVDFSNKQGASDIINAWCEKNTKNRIKNVINPDGIDSDTALILVNALYFKGKWNSKFPSMSTKFQSFHLDGKTKKNVLMMNHTETHNWGNLPELNAKYVELSIEVEYSRKTNISMFIIIPDNIDGLKEVETKLQRIHFKQLHEKKNYKRIELYLPKFKIESTIELTDVLKKMDMKIMFDQDKADFTGIAKVEPPLYINKVVQKAFLEVNETGCEAAAFSALRLCGGGDYIPPPPPVIIVDRPFFCSIVHANTGIQLFNARVTDPSLA